jgi:hypothetical protein
MNEPIARAGTTSLARPWRPRAVITVAWLAIWFATLMTCAKVAESFMLKPNQVDGFAAMLGLVGVIWGGPIGFLLSSLVAKRTGGTWLFLAGAALTGLGTVAWLVGPRTGILGLPFRVLDVSVSSPIVQGLAFIAAALVLVRARARRKAEASAPETPSRESE